MTKIKGATGNPRGAGRKPLPPGQKKLKATVSLAPDVLEELTQHGGGVLSRGIEMMVRDSVVTNDAGEVVGMVHMGPGEAPFQAWSRKRLAGAVAGNSHSLLGTFATMDEAVTAIKKAS